MSDQNTNEDDETQGGVPDYSGEPEQNMRIKADDPRPKSVNKKLVYGLGSVCVLLAVGVVYASVMKQRSIAENMQGEAKGVNVSDIHSLPASGADLPGTYGDMRIYNRQKELDMAPQGPALQNNIELPVSLQAQESIPSNNVPEQGPAFDPNDPRLMAARQAAMQRLTAQTAAITGSSAIRPASSSVSRRSGVSSPQNLQSQPNFAFPAPQMAFAPDETLHANNQEAKQGYLEETRETQVYLNQPLIKPVSPYQVMAGNIIPSSLITGLSSDLPGILTAQVRHNVYDSVTGRHLLIPQGTRIIGEYSSAVTYGQNRALVVWNRLIYPNGKSIVLEGMPGVDLSGYAGFKDKVDYHFWRMMGAAVLGAVVATAADAAEDDGDSLSDNVLGGTAETADQTIQRIIQKQLNVQPTIKIRPGYRFNIVVLADMVLEPYDPRPATAAIARR